MQLGWIDRRRFRQVFTVGCITATLLCIFPPDTPFFGWWSRHSTALAVAFLALGMVFLSINRIRLMFVCLGCSGSISFWLLETQGAHPLVQANCAIALYDGRNGLPPDFRPEEPDGVGIVLGLPDDACCPEADSTLAYPISACDTARIAVFSPDGAFVCRTLPGLGVLLTFFDQETGYNWWVLVRDVGQPDTLPEQDAVFLGQIIQGPYVEAGLIRNPGPGLYPAAGLKMAAVPSGAPGDKDPALLYLRFDEAVQCSRLDTLLPSIGLAAGMRAACHYLEPL
jgi:hypothetical protein